MKQIETLSLKKTKGGHRVYLNNKTLEKIGFKAGVGFDEIHEENCVRIIVSPDSERKVLNCGRGPLMDLRNKKLGQTLPDCDRVSVDYKEGEITLRVYHHEERVRQREKSLISKVKKRVPLRMGELFAGIGLLSKQLHMGLLAAGLSTTMAFGNELERLPADVNVNSNPIWQETAPDAVFVNDDIMTMDKSLVPELDCLVIGYPCTPFSRQQGANRKRDLEHDAGALFIPTLDIINRANPALVVLENSDNMLNSTTLSLMDRVMSATGYYRTETVVNGHDHGDFERRKRLCLVWVSKGLQGLDMSKLVPTCTDERRVHDIVEPMPLDDKTWRDMSHIAKKDNEHGHNHKMCVAEMHDKTMPTIPATYAKCKADTPLIAHPEDQSLHRLLTVSEHANVRRMEGEYKQAVVSIGDGSHHLTTRTNATGAHMMLGNSVAPQPWAAVGRHIGKWLTGEERVEAVNEGQVSVKTLLEDNGQIAMAF